MKKLSISALAFAALFSVSTLTADNITNTYNLAGTPVSITSRDQSVVVYFNSKDASETVNVNIISDNGDLVLKETIAGSKRYNVSKLERGNYTLTLTKKDAKTVQPFQVTEGGVVIEEKQKKAYFTPAIFQKDASLQVNALTGQYTNITVMIQDASGKTVFEDKNYVVFRLHKAYNISELPEGDYRVVVQAGEETYSQEFTK
jgi:hypothetical protein